MKTAWIFVAGIGSDMVGGYSNKFTSTISQHDQNSDYFVEFNWQKLLEPCEQNIFNKCGKNLKYKYLRQFMASYASDALLYHYKSDIYKNISQEFTNIFTDIFNKEYDTVNVVGHSLGSFIIANFIWDLTNKNPDGSEIFSLSEDISNQIKSSINSISYLASPSSLWAGQFISGGKNIDYSNLYNLKNVLNIYSQYDVIAWPQACLNDTFSNIKDININYGPIWAKYLPISHIYVWSDSKIINTILEHV